MTLEILRDALSIQKNAVCMKQRTTQSTAAGQQLPPASSVQYEPFNHFSSSDRYVANTTHTRDLLAHANQLRIDVVVSGRVRISPLRSVVN